MFLYTCGGDVDKLKMAVFFQMTYEGAPSVFYGDEVGLMGLTEPEYRRAMEWDGEKQNQDLLEHYKKLIQIRNGNAALRRGDFIPEIIDERNSVYGFSRIYGDEKTMVIINNSAYEREISFSIVSDQESFKDLYHDTRVFKNAEGKLTLKIGPYSGSIIKV